MPEPLTTSIATALVTGASGALSDGVRMLITKLAALVRERFRRTSSSDQETLEAAVGSPGDRSRLEPLAEAIGRHMREDPAFAEHIRALWTELVAAEASHGDDVTNVVGGPVHGSVVQARDVQGGINVNAPPPPSRATEQ